MTPRRRPLHRDNLGIQTTLTHHLTNAPQTELGLTQLRQAMRTAGWTTRTPDDDRKPNTSDHQDEPSALDYTDPTGTLALTYQHLHNDVTAWQEHWRQAQHHLNALDTIARRHLPTATPSAPSCSIATCPNEVEHKVTHGRTIYLDMEQIAGWWTAKPGTRPTCPTHRRHRNEA